MGNTWKLSVRDPFQRPLAKIPVKDLYKTSWQDLCKRALWEIFMQDFFARSL
jgi:hypothetical protein